MTVTIQLTKGYTTIVDDCDADLAQYKWRAHIGNTGIVYAVRSGDLDGRDREVKMHRLILGRTLGRAISPSELVDHEDNCGTNNSRSNLRLATHQQNAWNRRVRKDSRTGYKGVTFHTQTQKWQAKLQIGQSRRSLGLFTSPELAHEAYIAAVIELAGEFAHDGFRCIKPTP
jgi:hypothetical protein